MSQLITKKDPSDQKLKSELSEKKQKLKKQAKAVSKTVRIEHAKAIAVTIGRVRTLLARKAIIMETVNSSLRTYFDSKTIDVKSDMSGRELKLINDEIKMARDAIRAFKGFSKLGITFYTFSVYNSSAGGVVSTVLPLDPSPLTEWASCAQLFDEYRLVGGVYKFSPHGVITIPAATVNVLGMGVIGYDPSDNTAYSQVVSGTQDEQHLLFPQAIAATNGTSIVTTQMSHTHAFRYRVPPGVLQNSTLSVSNWQATNTTGGALLPYGFFKLYSKDHQVSSSAIGGVLEWHLEFRMRE